MAVKTKDGPKSPDERYEEQRAKEGAARAEREAITDFHEEERALSLGEDCDVSHTATGKMIRRHGSARNHDHHRHLQEAFRLGGLFQAVDRFTHDLISFATATILSGSPAPSLPSDGGISGKYNKKVKTLGGLMPQYEDAEYIYDAMFVSKPAYDKLIRESETIAAKVAELEAIDDLAKRDVAAKKIAQLAEEFEMRIHPITGQYVHNFERVMREEKSCNHGQAHAADLGICVFILKASAADLRGIKAKIGDPYNQDPAEAIASGDHLKGAAPAPAPV